MLPALVHGMRHPQPLQYLQLAAVWKPHMPSAANTGHDVAAAAAASIHSSAGTLQQQQQQSQQHLKQLLPEGVIVLPMPSLSHAMERGTVKRWLKQEGELCQEYDLVRRLGCSTGKPRFQRRCLLYSGSLEISLTCSRRTLAAINRLLSSAHVQLTCTSAWLSPHKQYNCVHTCICLPVKSRHHHPIAHPVLCVICHVRCFAM
jgi:hypothetical protein